MHTPEIKKIRNDLWTHFTEILKNNWKTIYNETKFHTSYTDQDKEVTLRFRVKEKQENKVIIETEKEIKYSTWNLPVEKEIIEVII